MDIQNESVNDWRCVFTDWKPHWVFLISISSQTLKFNTSIRNEIIIKCVVCSLVDYDVLLLQVLWRDWRNLWYYKFAFDLFADLRLWVSHFSQNSIIKTSNLCSIIVLSKKISIKKYQNLQILYLVLSKIKYLTSI